MRVPLPGATYSFALPSGDWGALYPDHIQTSRGRVELPGEDVLFLVGTLFNGVIYMAGQGHTSGKAWLWNGSAWLNVGPTFGVSPCVFGFGELLIAIAGDRYRHVELVNGQVADGAIQVGSQGFRYIEAGRISTGDATYRKGELFEYTTRGDVEVGQGHESGCWINGHLLEPGDCRFIRFDRENDLLAVAIVKLPEQQAVLHWLHLTDIALLPVQAAPPPVHPVPVPVPPQPEPKPVSTLPANVKNIRDRYVAKFPVPVGPNPSDEQFENICRGWILGMAEQIRFETNDPAWGVKNAGGGRPQSKDSLANNGPRLINFDLLTGVGTGRPGLVPDPQGEDITGQTFMPVAAINHLGDVSQPKPEPQPEPEPVPDVPVGTDGDVERALAVNLAILVELRKLSAHLGVR